MPSTLIGNPAPSFDLPCTRFPDPSRNRAALDDYRGGWLLLLFYPRDFSLVCPTELIGLSQRFEEFEQHHCQILGVSCDPVDLHERWMATPVSRGGLGGLNFPLASDADGAVSQMYGVYQASQHVAVRGLFIIDPEGLVQYQVVHSLSIGRRSQEVLRVLTALQSGGLCREDWMPDQSHIDPFSALRAGSFLLALSDRVRDWLGHLCPGLPGARPSARPARGAQGVQAGLPGDAQHRAGRGALGRRAQSSQCVHDLRGG